MRLAELVVEVEVEVDALEDAVPVEDESGLTDVDTGVEVESVAFLHVTSLGTVALADRVRSAHYTDESADPRDGFDRFAHAYLVELTVATVEDELKGHVRAILNAADASGVKVEINAEKALSGCLEERHGHLEVATAVPEIVERVGVLNGGNDTTH